MMRHFLIPFAAFMLLTGMATGQIRETLQVNAVIVVEQTDVYGQTVSVAQGTIENTGSEPYANLIVTAEVMNEAGDIIGEGVGYLVDACGAGLLADYVLPAGHEQPFSIPLELYEEDALFDRVRVSASGEQVGDILTPTADVSGIQQLSDSEVVLVRWDGPRSLQYAVGCQRDLSSEWDWHQYNSLSGVDRDLLNPYAPLITDDLRERLSLTDPLLFENSRLSFAPGGTRLAYQDGVNRFYTASLDGRLQRQIHGSLNNRQLQEIEWLANDRLIARYFGAYGDPVLYFTGNAQGLAISPAPRNVRPSVIRPGATQDGRRVILAGTFEDDAGEQVTGYYISVVSNGFFELLFAGESPGNNYPPPVPVVDPEDDLVKRIYVVRDVNGSPTLQCFNRDSETLTDLAPLPITLAHGDTSGLWLSPDETTLALSATGVNSGLWLIDLNALPACA